MSTRLIITVESDDPSDIDALRTNVVARVEEHIEEIKAGESSFRLDDPDSVSVSWEIEQDEDE